ncbi:isopentenyl-diphosphate Delta-isomerase [Patescibacteria group bacterium]
MTDKDLNNSTEEVVILVDENDNEIDKELKSKVHHKNTPLHRAFSLFLFNDDGKILATQRGEDKKTWPNVWSNSICGHPGLGESREDAVKRRMGEELGCGVKNLTKVSDYRYRFERDGVVENEICPVFYGEIDGDLAPNPKEIQAWGWFEWGDFLDELRLDDENKWSEWSKEEVILVDEFLKK